MSNKLAGREKNIVTVEITVDKEAVEKAYQQASQNVSKKVSVPGFRNFLESVGVSLIAGTAYGMAPYFRMSIATSIETIEQGCELIATAVAQLK